VSAEGVALLGLDRPGGRRLRETQAFMAFLRVEMPRLMQRWQQHRERLLTDPDAVPD
jgi:hypothetical protein